MFFGLDMEKFLLIGLVAVLLLGPERLPRYAEALAKLTVRAREWLDGAKTRVKEEMGEDFEDVEWRKLDPRQYDPRRIIRDALLDDAPVPTDLRHVCEFDVAAGETVDLSLTWYPSYREPPEPFDADDALEQTIDWWEDWAARSNPPAPFDEQVQRSLLVLRALTHEDTGGIVAAATTSLPEEEGGVRNWDYRYVWLRDAALTIEVLITHGYRAARTLR